MQAISKKQSSIKKRQIWIMRNGFNLGEKGFNSRDDLYERK